MTYYIYEGTEPQGPYTIGQLQQLSIKRDTIVWHEGMEKPLQAIEIESLKGLVNKIPPSLTKENVLSAPPKLEEEFFSEKQEFVSETDEPVQKKRKVVKKKTLKIAVLGVLFIIGGIGISSVMSENGALYYNSSGTNINEGRTKPVFENAVHDAIEDREERERKQKYRGNLTSYLNPHPNNYKKDLAFGGIWNAAVKMDNPTPYTIDRAVVVVGYYRANGNLYKTEKVVFTNLQPGKRHEVKAPKSEKGVEMRCWMESAYSYELQ